MNIVGKARAFVHSLEALAKKTAWDWRKCPKCGKDDTIRYGTYSVNPWFLDGRHKLAIQRHYCQRCRKTYSEQSSYLVRGSWYAREVHRLGIDFWQHGRTSLRKDAELDIAHVPRLRQDAPRHRRHTYLCACDVERPLLPATIDFERDPRAHLAAQERRHFFELRVGYDWRVVDLEQHIAAPVGRAWDVSPADLIAGNAKLTRILFLPVTLPANDPHKAEVSGGHVLSIRL